MSHYAVIVPPLYSHLRAMEALSRALIARGHRITFIHQPDARAQLTEVGAGFFSVGGESHPPGSLARTLRLTASPSAAGIFRLIEDLANTTDMLCRELPAALTMLGIEGVIADQMEAAGGLVSEALGLPFVSVACALPVNRDDGIPLPVMPFAWSDSARSRKIYAASAGVYDRVMRRQGEVVARHARAFGLSERRGLHECLSPLAQISQTITGFDFPRRLPACFHAVGPLRGAAVRTAQRHAEGDSRPRVFASLGTLQGHRYSLFRTIARACRRLDARLLIAHCGGLNAAQAADLAALGAEVKDFVDQPAALRQSQVIITHGGLNTVMDAIDSATPILTLPLAFDQPGVAARVVYSGIGRRASRFTRSRSLAASLDDLLSDTRYQTKLASLQQTLRQAGGAESAASIVEQALVSGLPVTARVA